MLPFKVAPTKTYEKVAIGNEEIGILEIEKYEDLTVAERRFIKEQNLFSYPKALASLAKKVSIAHGAKFAYVNDRISAYVFGGVIEGDTVQCGSKSGTVASVVRDKDYEITSFSVEIDGKTVTKTLDEIELVSPDWYAETYQEIQDLTTEFLESLNMKSIVYATAIVRFRLMPDWTIEHTFDPSLIHPQLVEQIASFAYKEEQGWKQSEPSAPQPSTDEDLGKS